ncbi:RapZ C-terminal domain-containing protein [Streptomyces globosus]|uniref:RapZ C-terminal domain-containing protein n=1 Tax=Streptomyces globosus TaxID=68209 RepID=UPI0031D3FC91
MGTAPPQGFPADAGLVRGGLPCQGGRHRSVAVAEAVGRLVWQAWGGAYGVEIEHHHIDHPVLPASTPA